MGPFCHQCEHASLDHDSWRNLRRSSGVNERVTRSAPSASRSSTSAHTSQRKTSVSPRPEPKGPVKPLRATSSPPGEKSVEKPIERKVPRWMSTWLPDVVSQIRSAPSSSDAVASHLESGLNRSPTNRPRPPHPDRPRSFGDQGAIPRRRRKCFSSASTPSVDPRYCDGLTDVPDDSAKRGESNDGRQGPADRGRGRRGERAP
jgi:hypothetical protein